MTNDAIRYDLIVQEALRDAVRKVMTNVSREGLPGEHHFFITFKTGAPGVQLSSRMRQEYPDEMTIVLQHQFWDMKVEDDYFEVGLSFRNVPEKLSIPFAALTGFADPSVQFALHFETDLGGEEHGRDKAGNDSRPGAGKPKAGNPVPLALQTDPSDPAYLAAQREHRDLEKAKVKEPAASRKDKDKKPAGSEKESSNRSNNTASATPDNKDGSSKVVSIDAFRKKP